MTKTIHNPVPAERRRRYDRVRRESSVRALQRTVERTEGDIEALLAAGDAATAAGAITEVVQSMLLLAAAPAGIDGASIEADTARKEALARHLTAFGMPIAATMVAAALAYDRVVVAAQAGSTCH